jgi:uncharacterized protein YbjT (DUF2867 family)
MILVTGAAGKTGLAVIRALAARGAAVRGLVRRATQSDAVRAAGACEAVTGDLGDTIALTEAMRGVGAVYHICPNVAPEEEGYGRTLIAAAQAADVRLIGYHSVLDPAIEAMPHHWRKMRVEELLMASGRDVVILQPTAYMQNILAGWRGIVADGVYRVPYPVAARISLVDLDDVAQAAAIVLTQPGHASARYELVGTTPLSQDEVAAALTSAVGRPVRAEEEPLAAWEARAAALGEQQRAALKAMFGYYARHGLAGNPGVLRWLLGREPTSVAGFARRHAAIDGPRTNERAGD